MSSWTPPIPELGTPNSKALLIQALKHACKVERGIEQARLDVSGGSVTLVLSPWSWLFRQGKVFDAVRQATAPWVPEGKSLMICLRSPW